MESGHEEAVLRAEHLAGGDSTRRLHLGSLRSSSVRLAGAAPQLKAVRRRKAFRGVSKSEGSSKLPAHGSARWPRREEDRKESPRVLVQASRHPVPGDNGTKLPPRQS